MDWASPSSKRYAPVGRYIYCGSTKGKLSDEHIIPFGLQPRGVDWFLPKASCARCADITKRFEGFCLTRMFGPLRARIGLKTRRKKQRARSVVDTVFVHPESGPFDPHNIQGRYEDVSIAAAEFPLLAVGFQWPAPRLLRGLEPSAQSEGKLLVRYAEGELERHVGSEDNSPAMRLGTFNILHFQRMLAKIAHAYAIAEYGEQSFIPALTYLIRGQASTHASYYVGGLPDHAPRPIIPGVLHQMHRQDAGIGETRYLGISIQLFSPIGMPFYHVIVGQTAQQVGSSAQLSDA